LSCPAPAAPEAAEVLGQLGDFRLLREVGRGGMGVVYEAEQLSLNRRVALKVLPFAAALDPRRLQRFKNEAQAAAHLQHQHIVPVYYVGLERGVHFYAMQFIDGQTLAQMIHELRRQAGADTAGDRAGHRAPDPEQTTPYRADSVPAEDAATATVRDLPAHAETPPPSPSAWSCGRGPQFFLAAARLAAQAAEALEHAHQLGVVHRDIKPGNLLVDGRGALWVTDFGLAQVQGDAKLTLSGDLVGTLRYMSPEQALAQRVVVDHRADIYSLGVTLYELLTLEPAFGGTDRQALLRQIAFEEPRRPRRLNKAIPVELETIVLKAMEKNPAERYATAQELADDLEHFLKDEPIRARRPTAVQRARKWGRRHRAVVWSGAAAAAVVVILAIAGLSLGLILVDRERERTVAEQGRTAAALTQEARRRRQATGALNSLVSQFVEDRLSRQAELLPEHRAFLEQALKVYEEFAADVGQDEDARNGVANAYFRAGSILYRLGRLTGAEAAFARSRDLFAALAADFPRTPGYRASVARANLNLGVVRVDAGHLQEAADALALALDSFGPLVDANPSEGSSRESLANVHMMLGNVHHARGRYRQAEAAYRRAIACLGRRTAGAPDDGKHTVLLARTNYNLALVLQRALQAREAENAFRKAIALQKELVERAPLEPAYRADLAASYDNLAVLLAPSGRPEEVDQLYAQAVALQKQLAADFPSLPAYRQDLARTYDDQGDQFQSRGRLQAAEDIYRQAVTIQRQLAEQHPKVQAYGWDAGGSYIRLADLFRSTGRTHEAEEAYRRALAMLKGLNHARTAPVKLRKDFARAHWGLGAVLGDASRPREAEAAYRQALALQQPLADALPEDRALWDDLAVTYHSLGMLLARGSAKLEAEEAYRKAQAIQRRLVKAFPGVAGYRHHLARFLNGLGTLLADAGRPDQAQEVYDEAEAGFKKLVADFPDDPDFHNELAGVLVNRAQLPYRAGDYQTARRLLEEAVPHHQAAIKAKPLHVTYRAFYRNNRLGLTRVLMKMTGHATVAAAARQLVEAPAEPLGDAVRTGALLARCVGLAEQDPDLDESQRRRLTAAYGERALKALQRAVEQGYRDAHQLETAPVFDPLRGQAGFQKLVRDLKAQAAPGRPAAARK
jgi:serine/threonine protein kinase/tetratricopeptide (TPR) repeat protein